MHAEAMASVQECDARMIHRGNSAWFINFKNIRTFVFLMTEMSSNNPIVLFDGLCNLCSNSVQFIIKHDPQNRFRFASLQSDFGQKILSKNHLSATELNSFILYENGKIYTRSTGALKVAKQLSGPWKLLSAFLIIPTFVRDGIYNLVSRNRYKWFGKKSSCWLPSKSLNSRFIS